MTTIDTTKIDLPTLDRVIAKHLQAHARRIGAETAHWDECLGCGHIRRLHWLGERCERCDCTGFLPETLERSGRRRPDRESTGGCVQRRDSRAATVADERAKWGLPA